MALHSELKGEFEEKSTGRKGKQEAISSSGVPFLLRRSTGLDGSEETNPEEVSVVGSEGIIHSHRQWIFKEKLSI